MRRAASLALVAVAMLSACAGEGATAPVILATSAPVGGSTAEPVAAASTTVAAAAPTTVATTPAPTIPPTSPPTTVGLPPDGKSSAERRLSLAHVVSDAELQPKSVVHSGSGLFFAENMMYRHNVSVYDRSGAKVATIPDTVDLARYGVAAGPTVQGSPVEAAFSPDGRHAFVSNYKMYGPGYRPVASDDCGRGTWDSSFVYRIDTTTFAIDAVIPVGAVPKYLAVTPDGRSLVVSNWCTFDVSVVDLATLSERGRVDVGRHPRGIAITADARTAYVTVMGEARIVAIDLGSLTATEIPHAGATPRHLVLSPDDRYLYVSNNVSGTVRKIDLATGALAAQVSTGRQPRSMVLADDGAVYVVNYVDGTVSKVRTVDMAVVQTERSGVHPVGITYDPALRRVWVANYAGSLSIFQDAYTFEPPSHEEQHVIEVVDDDASWPQAFEVLRERYLAALAGVPVLAIEHVGSTSVPGLAAKPVIDIDIVVAEPDVEAASTGLEAIGYEPLGDMGVPQRWAFRPPEGTIRTNTYVTVAGCLSLRNHLAVRDVLRRDAGLRDGYGALKQRLGAELDDIDEYVEAKSAFIQEILHRAGLDDDELAVIEGINRR